MARSKTKKTKPVKMQVAPTEAPVALSPKENAKQAIALCHNLILTGGHSYDRHEQIKAALGYLESLFKQVSDAPDAPAAKPIEEPSPSEVEAQVNA